MIQHVTRVVAPGQLDDCVAFYALLGFERVPVPAGIEGRALWLEHAVFGSAAQIHLMPREDARAEQGHLALVVRDYEQVLSALRAAGHEVDPRRPHWGSPRAYAHDPAGNVVELMAWAPRDATPPP